MIVSAKAMKQKFEKTVYPITQVLTASKDKAIQQQPQQ